MADNEQTQREQDDATEAAGRDEEPKSDVAQEIESDPSQNPDEQHLKDLKGA